MPNATPHLNADNTNPGVGVATITPSDVTNISTGPCRAVYVGSGGNISLLAVNGSSATLLAVPTGAILPISVTRINATGTTATDMVALY